MNVNQVLKLKNAISFKIQSLKTSQGTAYATLQGERPGQIPLSRSF